MSTLLQCWFGTGVLGMLAYGRHSHKGHREKGRNVAPYLLRVSARFLFSELRGSLLITLKLKWGQSVAWLNSGKVSAALYVICSNLAGAFSGTISHPHFHTRLAGWIIKPYRNHRAHIGAVCEQWCLFLCVTFPAFFAGRLRKHWAIQHNF